MVGSIECLMKLNSVVVSPESEYDVSKQWGMIDVLDGYI